ncbi:MAG: DEAD/DEAH box helicase [Bacteroidales bacterium]|jgi:hypothetical protein|nr:DEAD/DEAH box helicase [Bacteroidales bacterium]
MSILLKFPADIFENRTTLTIITDYFLEMFGEVNQGQRDSGFVVVLTHHRTWGVILVPYTYEQEPGRRFCTVRESLSPYPGSDILGTLTPDEREVVKLINDYSEKNLHMLFSREPNIKKFLESLTPENFNTVIRPYIETRIFKALSIMREEGIPLLHQRLKSTNYHSDDVLTFCHGTAEGIFRFSRTPEGTRYSLSVINDGSEILLYNSGTDILVNSPCVIRNGNRIIFIKALDGVKLKPFLAKDHLMIPPATEEKYFRSFVLNAVTSFRFEATGFQVLTGVPEKRPWLLVESTIRGTPALILSYGYSGTTVFEDDPRSSFTLFENRDGNFVFTRHFRDPAWEENCRLILEDQGFFSDDNIHFVPFRVNGSQGEDMFSLIEALNRSYDDLVRAGFEIRQGNLGRPFHLGRIDLKSGYTMVDDWFDLKADVIISDFSIPFTRFRKNIMEGIREYVLPDGKVAVLPEAWFTLYRDVFGLGKLENDSLKIHKQHFPVINEALGADQPGSLHSLEKLIMPDRLPQADLPEGLHAEMRPYQVEGFRWILFLQANKLGGCLADDMGLGKTIQVLAVLLHNKEKTRHHNLLSPVAETGNNPVTDSLADLFSHGSRRLTSLIIVPASLLHNWENEIRMYTPALKIYTYKGTARRKSNSYFGNYDIILSSYHTVRQDIDIMSEYGFHYIILDESQVIKNPGSAVYRAVSRLKGEHRMVLTGTPVENSLTDLWTQMNFVNPGLLGSLLYFRNEFTKPIEKMPDNRKEEKLKAIIKPFILRRTKEMVAGDLPPVWEQLVYCDMTEEQASLYEREKSAIRNSIMGTLEPGREENQAILVLQGLMRLRQIANHPVLTTDGYAEGSGKFDIALHDIKSVTQEGHKILLFSSFVKHLNLYAEALTMERIGFAMLTGSTINREEVVREFQNDDSCRVFLISLKAGGVGLNLTAADYVFILDPWWNPAAEMQALNRAHRIGQKKNVFVFRYICAETIEEKIIRLQERKSKLADTFINSNNPLKDMDINQILEILG